MKNLALGLLLILAACIAQAQTVTTNPSITGVGVNLSGSAISGTLPVANGGTGVTTSTGSGSTVLSASPTLTGTLGVSNITGTGGTYSFSGAFVGGTTAITLNNTDNTSSSSVSQIGVNSGGASAGNAMIFVGQSGVVNWSIASQASQSSRLTIGPSTPGSASDILRATQAGAVSLPTVTTGTNADFVCMASGNVLTLQTSACTISSMRFKRDITPLDGQSLRMIRMLQPVVFNMREMAEPNPDPNYARRQIGLLAENVAAVDSRMAIYENDGVTPKSYRQEAVIALLVKAVQEQQTEIAHLRADLKELERRSGTYADFKWGGKRTSLAVTGAARP